MIRNGGPSTGVLDRMKRILVLPLILSLAAPAVAQGGATGVDAVRCALGAQPARKCSLKDSASSGGAHTMVFTGAGPKLTFVGKRQNGWWSGRLNGKPAMGYERNRGYVVMTTYDLSTNFAWWYPGSEHGTY